MLMMELLLEQGLLRNVHRPLVGDFGPTWFSSDLIKAKRIWLFHKLSEVVDHKHVTQCFFDDVQANVVYFDVYYERWLFCFWYVIVEYCKDLGWGTTKMTL